MAKHRASRKVRGHFRGLRQLSDQSAVFLFILFLIIVLFLMDSFSDQAARYPDKEKLAKDVADRLLAKFTADSAVSSGTALIIKDTIDADVLDALSKMDYSQLKSYLGVDSDFAIQLQSLDGEVIPIGDKLCIGSKDATVNGIPCG